MSIRAAAFFLTIACLSGPALAEASGPDQFEVTGVSRGDALNMRKAPSAKSPVIDRLQNGDRVRNLGCKQVQTTRWCKVENAGTYGWVSNRYIREYVPSSPAATRPPREPAQQLPLGDTAETSLDWDGTYSGILPCRGCKGIKTSLTLKPNKTFVLREVQLNRNAEPQIAKGRFQFDLKHSSVIRLDEEANFRAFFVGENFVEEVDLSKGKPRPTRQAYRLQKN